MFSYFRDEPAIVGTPSSGGVAGPVARGGTFEPVGDREGDTRGRGGDWYRAVNNPCGCLLGHIVRGYDSVPKSRSGQAAHVGVHGCCVCYCIDYFAC